MREKCGGGGSGKQMRERETSGTVECKICGWLWIEEYVELWRLVVVLLYSLPNKIIYIYIAFI